MDKLPNPFMTGFDESRLLEALAAELDPSPAFIRDPSEDYLRAVEIMPIVEILQEHMR